MSLIKSVFIGAPSAGLDNESSLESLFLEANKINTECAELEFGIESLDVVMDQLDSLSASVEAYGNDSNCRSLLRKQAEILLAPLGMDPANVGQPSVEGIKSWAQDLWKTIMDAFKKIWHKMKDWYLKMFSGAARLVSAAEKLRDAASKATGTADEKKIELGSTFKALAIEKSSKSIVFDGLNTLATKTVDSGKASEKASSEEVIKYLDSGTVTSDILSFTASIDKKGPFNNTQALLAYSPGSGKDTANADSGVKPAPLHTVNVGDVLPGNKAVFANRNTGDQSKHIDGKGAVANKVTFGTFNTKLKLEDGSFDSLESGGIEDLADKVITIAQQVVDYQKSFKDTDKYKVDLDKAMVNFNKMVDTEDKITNKDVVRSTQRLANMALNRLDHPRQEIISYLLSTCSATLTFGSKCLSNLKA